MVLCPTRERAGQALAALAEILAGLGLALAPAKTLAGGPAGARAGFDFLGFHHRRVESFTRKGRYFWPAGPPTARCQGQGQDPRAHRPPLLGLPVEDVVAHLNVFLAGWRGYFRHGNSTTVFHDLDGSLRNGWPGSSEKHGHHGRDYGLRVLVGHDYLGRSAWWEASGTALRMPSGEGTRLSRVTKRSRTVLWGEAGNGAAATVGSERCLRETTGTGAGTYRRSPLPRQPPTRPPLCDKLVSYHPV